MVVCNYMRTQLKVGSRDPEEHFHIVNFLQKHSFELFHYAKHEPAAWLWTTIISTWNYKYQIDSDMDKGGELGIILLDIGNVLIVIVG